MADKTMSPAASPDRDNLCAHPIICAKPLTAKQSRVHLLYSARPFPESGRAARHSESGEKMKQVKMYITRDPGAEDIELPEYKSAGASGMDVRAAVSEPVTLRPGEIKLIPTGLRMAVMPGYEIQVRPRSGLALKHGITVVNTPGTIDADYRGPVGVILANISNEPFEIKRGERIAQLVVQEVLRANIEVVASLDETGRGEGGFGSTGR